MSYSFSRVRLQYCTIFRFFAPAFKTTAGPQANAVIISLTISLRNKALMEHLTLLLENQTSPLKKENPFCFHEIPDSVLTAVSSQELSGQPLFGARG